MLKKWEDLPEYMQNDQVRIYYNFLINKKHTISIKRAFDFVFGLVLMALLLPILLIIAICIKLDSKGSVFFRQERITQYGKKFRIYKFRTMVMDAEKKGTKVTTKNDDRITKIGKILRKYRLDELPQVINIIKGDMSFVGTRPEVTKYVEQYTDEMYATLLLPAGVTSEASILYKDENSLLDSANGNVDDIYINKILPQKMSYNLRALKKFGLIQDLYTITRTVKEVFIKD